MTTKIKVSQVLSNDIVDLTSDQDIKGIKTFITSPIVPTPDIEDSSSKVATTRYVKEQGYVKENNKVDQLVSKNNGSFPLLFVPTNNATEDILSGNTYFGIGIKANPLTSTVIANTFQGSLSGNASSATAFSIPKSVTITGAVNGTFASTAGWSIPTTWRNCIVGQSTSNESNPWYKVASITLTNPNYDSRIIFLVENTDSGNAIGILHVHIKTDQNKKVISTDTSLSWLFNHNFINDDFVLICPSVVSPTCELWTKVDTGYMHRSFTVLSEGNRTTSKIEWVLFNTSSEGFMEHYPNTGIHFISK